MYTLVNMTKKKSDTYLNVVATAFVTIPEKNSPTAKILVKYKVVEGTELVGFAFDRVDVVDETIAALQKVRAQLSNAKPLHPMMRIPITGGHVH